LADSSPARSRHSSRSSCSSSSSGSSSSSSTSGSSYSSSSSSESHPENGIVGDDEDARFPNTNQQQPAEEEQFVDGNEEIDANNFSTGEEYITSRLDNVSDEEYEDGGVGNQEPYPDDVASGNNIPVDEVEEVCGEDYDQNVFPEQEPHSTNYIESHLTPEFSPNTWDDNMEDGMGCYYYILFAQNQCSRVGNWGVGKTMEKTEKNRLGQNLLSGENGQNWAKLQREENLNSSPNSLVS